MLKKYVFILATLFISSNALAQWELINDESSVNYVSVKSSTIGELNSFKKLSGTIQSKGELSVDVDLASVESNIPIRNDRLKTILFKVSTFSKANITTTLDPKLFNDLAIGETYRSPVTFNLSLHGISKEITTDIRVVKLTENKILAFSLKPIIINAGQYNFLEGIEKLREVAVLPSISPIVPVTFSLVFKQ